jgi:hypothetical protein
MAPPRTQCEVGFLLSEIEAIVLGNAVDPLPPNPKYLPNVTTARSLIELFFQNHLIPKDNLFRSVEVQLLEIKNRPDDADVWIRLRSYSWDGGKDKEVIPWSKGDEDVVNKIVDAIRALPRRTSEGQMEGVDAAFFKDKFRTMYFTTILRTVPASVTYP